MAHMPPPSTPGPIKLDGLEKHTMSPKSGWISMDGEDEDDLPSLSRRMPHDPSTGASHGSPGYRGFVAELEEHASSCVDYGEHVTDPPLEEKHNSHLPAGTSFMNDIVDYDAYSTAEPSVSSRTVSKSPEQTAASLAKRKVSESNGGCTGYGNEEKRMKASDIGSDEGSGRPGEPIDAGLPAVANTAPSEQKPQATDWRKNWVPPRRPLWVQELAKKNPELIAYFVSIALPATVLSKEK